MRSRAVTLLLLAPVTVASPAWGQETGPVRLTLDLGFVNASGNSDVTTFNLGQKLTFTTGRWVLAQTTKVIYGETDGSATAESYEAGVRGDYTIKGRLSAFALATYYRDPFSGVAARWTQSAGLALRAVQTPRDSLSVEGALSVNQERSTAPLERTFGAARSALAFKHVFGATAFFTQTLEWLANLEDAADQRLNAETALTAPLSRRVALKAAYAVRFDHQPEPGFEDTDRVLTTGLQIVFE
jgi:putative salt-induced outer membrane protein YdiY